MADNYNEGHAGYTIVQTGPQAKNSLPDRPNIVLVHVGNNGLNWNPDLEDPTEIIEACPDATTLVAQIVGSADPRVRKRIDAFNKVVPDNVSQRVKVGSKVLVADMSDMSDMSADNGMLVTDGIHPNDFGYTMMANTWYQGIEDAVGRGWVKAPIGADPNPYIANDAPENKQCLPEKKLKVGANGPAVFNRAWTETAKAAKGFGKSGPNVQFADLRGKGKVDCLWIDDKKGSILAWYNDGIVPKFKWTKANNGKVIIPGYCLGTHVRLPNLTGSGQSDYVCIDDKGARVRVWFNKWIASGGWKWDTRDDMVVKYPDGSLRGYLNLGRKDSTVVNLISIGQTAPGFGTDITFGDVNGDGRDDILIWQKDGGVRTVLNLCGYQDGTPVWSKQQPFKDSVGAKRADARIAEIIGNGLIDYIVVDRKTGAVDVYANTGSADVSRVRDGSWAADLNGDGLEDKVLITAKGEIELWLNGKANPKASYGWSWIEQNSQHFIALSVGAKRENVRLADVDDDGKADMITIDPSTGVIKCWLNSGANKAAKPRGRVWTAVGQISPSRGDFRGIQFADVTGDGKADITYLDLLSKWTIWRNDYKRSGGSSKGDIDGDGKADAIWIHPNDGSGVVWQNKDPTQGIGTGWVRTVKFPISIIPS
ncbi:MAG: hypothetical protein Q9190_006156 [Brigantiaea leucoxantha]